MREQDDNSLVDVYCGTTVECDLTRCLLESHGIQAFEIGDVLGTLAPLRTLPGGIAPVRIQVRRKDALDAVRIIREGN